MGERVHALNAIVAMAREHGISAEDIRKAMQEDAGAAAGHSVSGRLLAYVGATFILCGLGFLIESYWNEMNSAARIVLYLGAGLVMLVLALMIVHRDRHANAAVPLFLLAAIFQAGGILVAFDELGTGGDPRHALLAMSLVMLAQTLLVFRVHRLTVLVFLAFAFATVVLSTAMEIGGLGNDLNMTLSGPALLGAAYLMRESRHAAILPCWYLVGGVLASFGAFEILKGTSVDILYVAYAALLVWFSTVAKSRVLLFVATFAMIGYLSYFTGEYFADSIGWPLALMIIGLIFIGLSVLAVRISRQYIGTAAS